MNPFCRNRFPHLYHQHEWFTRTLGEFDDEYSNYAVENHLILKKESEEYSRTMYHRRKVGENKKIHFGNEN